MRLDRLELGNFGDCKTLQEGISGLEIHYGPGIRIYVDFILKDASDSKTLKTLIDRVIGRVFKELQLIEQWRSGLQRILAVSLQEGLKPPSIEEHNNQFRLTLYNERSKSRQIASWEETILIHLENYPSITTKEASKIWKVSDRTARTRLKTMVELGRLQRIATSEKDPFATFVARK